MPQEPQGDELAGTWVFNNVITLNHTFGYSLRFISMFNCPYTYISVEEIEPGLNVLYFGNSDLADWCYDTGKNEWTSDSLKTIRITNKLSEMENGEEFLTWLKANATKTEDAPLSKPTPTQQPQGDELAGKWIFNEILTVPLNSADFDRAEYNLNYEVEGDKFHDSYVKIRFESNEEYQLIWLFFEYAGIVLMNTDYEYAYIRSTGEVYSTFPNAITITTKLSEMENGEEFLTWLKANATKQ